MMHNAWDRHATWCDLNIRSKTAPGMVVKRSDDVLIVLLGMVAETLIGAAITADSSSSRVLEYPWTFGVAASDPRRCIDIRKIGQPQFTDHLVTNVGWIHHDDALRLAIDSEQANLISGHYWRKAATNGREAEEAWAEYDETYRFPISCDMGHGRLYSGVDDLAIVGQHIRRDHNTPASITYPNTEEE